MWSGDAPGRGGGRACIEWGEERGRRSGLVKLTILFWFVLWVWVFSFGGLVTLMFFGLGLTEGTTICMIYEARSGGGGDGAFQGEAEHGV